jgi:hypothetical protein
MATEESKTSPPSKNKYSNEYAIFLAVLSIPFIIGIFFG